MEMKSDVARLPVELSKIPPVSRQLKMDEISTLSRLANKQAAAVPALTTSQSVITQVSTRGWILMCVPGDRLIPTVVSPPPTPPPPQGSSIVTTLASRAVTTATTTAAVATQPSKAGVSHKKKKEGDIVIVQEKGRKKTEMVVVQDHSGKVAAQYPVAYTTTGGAIVQGVAPGSGLAVQTAEGLVVYGVGTTGVQYSTVQHSTVQQSSGSTSTTTSSSQAQGTYATIGVPAYVDSSNMYLQGQTVQLVQAPTSGQQTLQLVQAPSSGQAAQVMYWPVQQGQSGSAVGSQLAIVQGSQALLQPVQYTVDSNASIQSSPSKPGVITID